MMSYFELFESSKAVICFFLLQTEGQLPEAVRQELLAFGDRFLTDSNVEQISDSHSVVVKFSLSKFFL